LLNQKKGARKVKFEQKFEQKVQQKAKKFSSIKPKLSYYKINKTKPKTSSKKNEVEKQYKAILKANKILNLAKKTKMPAYFFSPDIAINRLAIKNELNKRLEQELSKKLELKKEINSGILTNEELLQKRLSLIQKIKRMLILFIRKILAWFNLEKKQMQSRITINGKRALQQLNDLYNLLLLEITNEEDLAALKIAYGEACYYITEASRQYYKIHKGKGKENYQEYFDRFVKATSSI
jgi:hypothetical protein